MTKYVKGPRIPGAGALARKMLDDAQIDEDMHRKAVRPKWGGRHGDRVKGSVWWDPKGSYWVVRYSFLLGYGTTARAADYWDHWSVAMNQYREHDRTVRERQRLEDFRARGPVL